MSLAHLTERQQAWGNRSIVNAMGRRAFAPFGVHAPSPDGAGAEAGASSGPQSPATGLTAPAGMTLTPALSNCSVGSLHFQTVVDGHGGLARLGG
jgi:hypothetical protein